MSKHHSRGAGRKQDDDAFLPWSRRWYVMFTRAGKAKAAKQDNARKIRRRQHQENHMEARPEYEPSRNGLMYGGDCQHGCNGSPCEAEACTFTCHDA